MGMFDWIDKGWNLSGEGQPNGTFTATRNGQTITLDTDFWGNLVKREEPVFDVRDPYDEYAAYPAAV